MSGVLDSAMPYHFTDDPRHLQRDPAQVDPVACLRYLNAGISRSPTDLAPVRPVLEF